MNCGEIQDQLPDRVAGRLNSMEEGRVDEHLSGCSDCRGVFEAVRELETTRPVVPVDLEARLLAAVRSAVAEEEVPTVARSRWRLGPAWGLAAAAVLALAVGLPVVFPAGPEMETEVGVLALAEEGVGQVWLDDDLMVAGAPAVSELSDEALRTLLEELER